MIPERQVKALVAIVIVALAALLLLQRRHVDPHDIYNAFSYAVTIVVVVLFLWNRYLWSRWPFNPHLTKRPDLRGTWKGELVSDYRDPVTHEQMPPIEVYVVIRQTSSTIDVRLFSAESSSLSMSAHFHADNVDLYTLASTYRNTPTVLRRGRSPINHGGLLLSVRGRPVHQLDGEYWTDRNTKGEILLTSRSADEAHDFAHARSLKYKACTPDKS